MHRRCWTKMLRVTDINQHFICVLCEGYIIDATTIVECLHSFCRTCIVNYLENSEFCPVCDVQVHKTKPLQSLMPDRTLQDVIYKLIPGLYEKEMQRRRRFFAKHPEADDKCSTEERCFYSPNEYITVTMEYFKGSDMRVHPASESTESEFPDKEMMTRHLNCPAAISVGHLKKLIRNKFSLPLTYMIKIMYADQLLSDDYTLMDIAYIYSWRRAGPMKFFYTFSPLQHVIRRKTFPPLEAPVIEIPQPPTTETSTIETTTPKTSTEEEPEKMEVEVKTEPIKEEVTSESLTESMEAQVSSTSSAELPKLEQSEIPKCPTSPEAAVSTTSETPSVAQPTSNGIKIKLVTCPSPKVKSKRGSTGRKGGKTRYKSAPVHNRFPRLAPYPPPCIPPAQCLTMRKFVPNVMHTSIPSNLMLSFVPSASNSNLCNVSNTAPTMVTQTSGIVVQDQKPLKAEEKKMEPPRNILHEALVSSGAMPPEVKCNGTAEVSRPAFYPPPQPSTCVATSPLGQLVMTSNNKVPLTINSSLMAALVSVTGTSTSSSMCTLTKSTAVTTVTKPAELVNGATAKKFPEPSMPILQTALCDNKSPQPAAVAPEETKVECNGTTPSKDPKFSSDGKKEFEASVKNSISAEFSDNDDLGCQPDLVVDEQKMDDSCSDNEEEDLLRKKITAIAEEKEEEDETEDSGRASDLSSQARSSCDDDSPVSASTTEVASTATTTTSTPCLPSFTLATASTTDRTVKSNNINHVINNLLKNHHERKDSMGALDLSTCTKKPGPAKPKPVANPVLDIKHRQHKYLPAPNNNSKQHTACVPSPKHPTSSPILMHGLTSPPPNLTPLQISAIRGKSPHLPVPPFHGTMMYTSQSSRTVPSPTCVPAAMAYTSQSRTISPGRSATPSYSTAMLAGMIPRMSVPTFPMRGATPNYGVSMPPMKGMSQSANLLKSLSTASSVRNFAPASHLKGIVSPPQNPYAKGGANKSNPVPSYKRSNSASPYPSTAKKQANSYKSYNTKFKSSGNLTVINPDPNGSLHKLVIRNLDARPTSPQSQKL